MNILIITHKNNLEGSAASHHIDDRLPHFQRRGERFRVLTSYHSSRTKAYRQHRVLALNPRDARVLVRRWLLRKAPNRVFAEAAAALLFILVLPFYLVETWCLPAHRSSIWWFVSASFAGAVLVRRDKPDVIYSTGGDNSAHLAGAILSRMFSIPWVAEFQDPLVHGYCAMSGLEMRFVRWLERMVQKRAGKVVFLTQTARRISEERTGIHGKGETIYPGTEPGLFGHSRYQKGETFRILHVGSFSGSRSPETFLSALARAVKANTGLVRDARFLIVGRTDSRHVAIVERFPFPEMIMAGGLVARPEAIRIMEEADVLLLIQNMEEVSVETIPSKTYEYLMAARPVLALVYRNTEIRRLLEDDCHQVVEADDIPAIERGILDYYDEWRSGRNRNCRRTDLTVERAVDKLMDVFTRAVEEYPS